MTAPALPARRFVLEDPDAPHQVTLFLAWPRHHHLIAVGCTCLGYSGNGRGRNRFTARLKWTAAEAISCWRAGHEPGVPG